MLLRLVLITLAFLFAVIAAGLIWGWPILFFEDRGWRQHSHGWIAMSLAAFAASCHPWTAKVDKE